MGDMADYYREIEERAFDELEEEPLSSDSIWTTKERQRIPIYKMGDSHLLNTIRVLRGKSPIGTTWSGDNVRRREWLNVMANEAYSRGLSIEEVDGKDPVHE
jgi:hypothetical protein